MFHSSCVASVGGLSAALVARAGGGRWSVAGGLPSRGRCGRSLCSAAAGVARDVTLDGSQPESQATNSALIKPTPLSFYRTSITDPSQHTWSNVGQFYTIPPEEANRVFCLGGFHKQLIKQMEATNEVAFMIRKPGLELISYLKAANYNMPVIRYVVYGRRGVGKTMTLAHAMHYCAVNDWFIIHLPNPLVFTQRRKFQEKVTNPRDPHLVDYPVDGVRVLNGMRRTNKHLLEKHELVTTKHYEWSKREATEVGTPLLEMIDFGINRNKYSCDVVGALFREIRVQAREKLYKTLVVVDNLSFIFGQYTKKVRRLDHSVVKSTEMTLVRQYLRQIENDWSGGAVVLSVRNPPASTLYTPKQTLTQQGFELVDPFVPIEVTEYTEDELDAHIDYYVDRAWITTPHVHTLESREQIKHLSGYNPDSLRQLVRHL